MRHRPLRFALILLTPLYTGGGRTFSAHIARVNQKFRNGCCFFPCPCVDSVAIESALLLQLLFRGFRDRLNSRTPLAGLVTIIQQ